MYFCQMFLRIIKKGVLVLGVAMMMLSCGEYQDVLKSKDSGVKYQLAEKLYTEGKAEENKAKLRKALKLFEQIVPEFRGKPQGQRVVFLLADTYYLLGDYFLSPFEFERFNQLYPDSDKAEEAKFKEASSYYYRSPKYNLDQTDTDKAIEELQTYLNTYPDGENAELANTMATELRVKLERKAYEIAKNYHHTEYYKAAIAAFNNFLADYPGSPFREAAYYYRAESAYLLATNSVQYLMEERLNEAKELYNTYNKYYPEGEYSAQTADYSADIDTRLQNF